MKVHSAGIGVLEFQLDPTQKDAGTFCWMRGISSLRSWWFDSIPRQEVLALGAKTALECFAVEINCYRELSP